VIVPRQSVEADFTLTNRERDRSAHLPVDVQASWQRGSDFYAAETSTSASSVFSVPTRSSV
jgi:hypothetical protein